MLPEAEVAARLFRERHGAHIHAAAADDELGRCCAALRRAAVGKALSGEQDALVFVVERGGIVKGAGLALDRGFHIAEPCFRRSGLHELIHYVLGQRLLVHAQIFIKCCAAERGKDKPHRRINAKEPPPAAAGTLRSCIRRGSALRRGGRRFRFLFFHIHAPSGRTTNAVGMLRGPVTEAQLLMISPL